MNKLAASLYEPLIDNGYVPDILLRQGVKHLLGRRVSQLDFGSNSDNEKVKKAYIQNLKANKDIAIHTKEANEQHYEIPTEFFQLCLGPRLKYSSCYFEKGAKTLGEAEIAMLDLYIERSGLVDGMSVLDLGCGWGSLCLYIAEKLSGSQVYALSNSATQREYILQKAESLGLTNVTVFTGDINTFEFDKKMEFDRILTIEMFEHMKNYQVLFDKISNWLTPSIGRLFIHVFAHKSMPYDFRTQDDHSWMAKYFFTGGTMPSSDLFMWFQKDLELLDRWTLDGRNYAKTSEEWLKNMDKNQDQILPLLAQTYGGETEAKVWFRRWRLFYISVAELFDYNQGQEWVVMHYLFKSKK